MSSSRMPHASFLALALLAAGALASPAHGVSPGPLRGGTIVAPRGSGLVMIDPATGLAQAVGVSPAVGVAGHATWSPDGTRVAVSRFGRRPYERVGGSDILLVPASGGPAVPVIEHDAEGVLLGSPSWTPDGGGLFFDYLPPNGGAADVRVDFVAIDGSGHRTVVASGAWPSLSPDGGELLYVRPSPTTGYPDELVALPLDGGPERVIVPSGQLVQIVSPRFSPDGSQIAFVGSLSTGEARLPREALADVLGFAMRAHGPPGDVWLVRPDGSGLWQRTAFEEDEPTLAWSPDGSWLAMLAGGGLYLMDPEGLVAAHRFADGGFGGIDWR